MKRETLFSPCRQYRYCLWREWDVANPSYAMFVGLKASTADEVQDDPTVRRCIGFSKRWGYGALCMMNLFAYRATRPSVMKARPAPVGRENDHWLAKVAKHAGVIVAAWGVHGRHLEREAAVIELLAGNLSCLGKTKDGHPRHPLYLKRTLRPRPFR